MLQEDESVHPKHRHYTNSYDKERAITCYLKPCLSILRTNKIIKDVDQAVAASKFLLSDLPGNYDELAKELWEQFQYAPHRI